MLRDKYLKQREALKIPLKLKDGTELTFSPGKHNEVQMAVITEFAPRFAPGSDLLYVGDTAKKDLHIDKNGLEKLEIPIRAQQITGCGSLQQKGKMAISD